MDQTVRDIEAAGRRAGPHRRRDRSRAVAAMVKATVSASDESMRW
jgi:hypothetical protein